MAGITTLFFMTALSLIKKLLHGIVVVAGGETVGIVGIDGAELPTLPVMGDTVVVGNVFGGLTPRLPIW
jgi:hypothetical protein